MTTLIVAITVAYFIIWIPSNLIAYLRWREYLHNDKQMGIAQLKEQVKARLSVPKRRHVVFTTVERADYCVLGMQYDMVSKH